MTAERQDHNTRRAETTEAGGRRPWQRPTLTAYGPIGKLTQGGTGAKPDATQSRKK